MLPRRLTDLNAKGFRTAIALAAVAAAPSLHAVDPLEVPEPVEEIVTTVDNDVAQYDKTRVENSEIAELRKGITRIGFTGRGEWRVPVTMRKGADGRMGMYSYGGGASFRHLSEDVVAIFRFSYERTQYDFKGSPALRWNNTHAYALTGFFEHTVAGNWGVYATGGARLGYEDGASTDNAISGAFSVGARYRFSPHFSYYFGVNSIYRLDYDVIVTPMLSFDFRMGRWTATTTNGLIITYDVFGDRSLVLEGAARFDMSDFRLQNDPATGQRRAVQFQEVPITFAATQNFSSNLYVRAYASFIAWSDYRFRTNESTSGDFQTHPGLALGLIGGARF